MLGVSGVTGLRGRMTGADPRWSFGSGRIEGQRMGGFGVASLLVVFYFISYFMPFQSYKPDRLGFYGLKWLWAF